MDEDGERKRKSFSGTTKQEVTKKMAAYVENFNAEIVATTEANKKLSVSMQNWLHVFKFPSVERTTYDRYEATAKHQIYPLIGDKIVGNITSADIKKVLNHWMTLAIEPMIAMTKQGERTTILEDGWTVVTRDRSLSAHFEHTVAITDDGCEILTLPADYP